MRALSAALLVSLVGTACTTTAASVCTPGEQVFCACPGARTSVQVCGPEGTKFGPCACADAGSVTVDSGPASLSDSSVVRDAGRDSQTPPDADPLANLRDANWWELSDAGYGCTTDEPTITAVCRAQTINCLAGCNNNTQCAANCFLGESVELRTACALCIDTASYRCAAQNGCRSAWQQFACCATQNCSYPAGQCVVDNCDLPLSAVDTCFMQTGSLCRNAWRRCGI